MVDALGVEPSTELSRGTRDEVGLTVAAGAQAVVDVHGDGVEAGVDGQGEKRERVRAARARDHDRRTDIVEVTEPVAPGRQQLGTTVMGTFTAIR